MVLFMQIVFTMLNGVMSAILVLGVAVTLLSLFTPSNQGWRAVIFPGFGALCLIETLLYFAFVSPGEGMRQENVWLYGAVIIVAVTRTAAAVVAQYRIDDTPEPPPDPIEIELQEMIAQGKG